MNTETGQISPFATIAEAKAAGFDVVLNESEARALGKLPEKVRVKALKAFEEYRQNEIPDLGAAKAHKVRTGFFNAYQMAYTQANQDHFSKS